MNKHELVILEDTGVKIYVPVGTKRVFVNYDIPQDDDSLYNTLRAVYRRTDRTIDSYPVFEHKVAEDR